MAAISKDSVYLGDVEDTREGDYFVSAVDGGQVWLMAGPYATHREALDLVEPAKSIIFDITCDPRRHFFGYGTCRLEKDSGRVGSLNIHGLI